MRLAILTNILTPYRMGLFAELDRQLRAGGGRLRVIAMAETERDRPWTYTELQSEFTSLLPHVSVSVLGTPLHITKGVGRILRSFDPDVVVCAGSYTLPAVWAVPLRRRTSGAHYRTYFWSESHLNEVHPRSLPTRALREALRRAVYRSFDGFLYAGRLSREFVELYARPRARMIYLPNTVEDAYYASLRDVLKRDRDALRMKYGVARDKYVFFTPARLTKVKGLDRFLELAAQMATKSGVTYLVAGSGDQEKYLRDRSKQLGVNMEFLGSRSIHEVAELYALADCMLLPSLADPNPLSTVEALWMGLPLFLSRHVGNYPEAVREGENGYVFDYSEPRRAIEMLDKIVQADSKWNENASIVSLNIERENYHSSDIVERLIREMDDVFRER